MHKFTDLMYLFFVQSVRAAPRYTVQTFPLWKFRNGPGVDDENVLLLSVGLPRKEGVKLVVRGQSSVEVLLCSRSADLIPSPTYRPAYLVWACEEPVQ